MMMSRELERYPGRLIAVEGLDGSGKSTQLYLLKRWLEMKGLKVFFTEWNSSLLIKKATSKGKKRQLLTPTTFSLIHCTDFADRFERQILPLLKAGYLVLCDRYIYTAFARDAVRGCSRTWLQNLYGYACHPDITFFFNTPLQVALGRILGGRPQLKYHEAGMDMGFSNDPYDSFRIFQGKIFEEYLSLRDRFSFIEIDGSMNIEDQQQRVREIISKSIDLPRYRSRTIG
ncbi:MAG: thymidylate kinase [Geobacteraceae bacterium]|nr:thymidylate kinase [Geobacteraceae bacterium]